MRWPVNTPSLDRRVEGNESQTRLFYVTADGSRQRRNGAPEGGGRQRGDRR